MLWMAEDWLWEGVGSENGYCRLAKQTLRNALVCMSVKRLVSSDWHTITYVTDPA